MTFVEEEEEEAEEDWRQGELVEVPKKRIRKRERDRTQEKDGEEEGRQMVACGHQMGTAPTQQRVSTGTHEHLSSLYPTFPRNSVSILTPTPSYQTPSH